MMKSLISVALSAMGALSFRRDLSPARSFDEALRLRHAKELGIGPFGEFEFGGVPGWGDLAQYGVVRPDAVEAVRQPLYDTLLYPTAGQTQLRFFQNPQGAGLSSQQGNAGNPKNLGDTNMELAGQLSSPKAFLATSIELIFEPGSVSTANTFTPAQVSGPTVVPTTTITIGQLTPAMALNDIQNVMMSSWLDFFLIAKSYLTNARVDSFPPKSYICYDASVDVGGSLNVLAVGCQGRAVGRPYYLNPPVLVLPNTNFNVTLNWGVVVATPSGFNGRIMCRLDGFLYRNAQ